MQLGCRSGAEQLLICQRVDGLYLLQDVMRIKPYHLCQIEKLNEIHATITVFNIGNERLMAVESFGDRSLRQSRQLSLLGQQLRKSPVAVRM